VIVAEHRVPRARDRLDRHAEPTQGRGGDIRDQQALLGEHDEARRHEAQRRHDRAAVGEAQDRALVPVAQRRELDLDVFGAPARVPAHECRAPRSRRDREGELEQHASDAARECEGRVDVDGGARGEPVGGERGDEAAERVAHDEVRRPRQQRGDRLDDVVGPTARRVPVGAGRGAMTGEVDGEHAEPLGLQFGAHAMPGPVIRHDAVDEDRGAGSRSGRVNCQLHATRLRPGPGQKPRHG
jgi:hypothetical protein